MLTYRHTCLYSFNFSVSLKLFQKKLYCRRYQRYQDECDELHPLSIEEADKYMLRVTAHIGQMPTMQRTGDFTASARWTGYG